MAICEPDVCAANRVEPNGLQSLIFRSSLLKILRKENRNFKRQRENYQLTQADNFRRVNQYFLTVSSFDNNLINKNIHCRLLRIVY